MIHSYENLETAASDHYLLIMKTKMVSDIGFSSKQSLTGSSLHKFNYHDKDIDWESIKIKLE